MPNDKKEPQDTAELPEPEKLFLPGVPCDYAIERLRAAPGNELGSGKFASQESSARLAVNTFGWFHNRPERLPPFPAISGTLSRATHVEIEYCARFPWVGGRHPWLDAFIETDVAIIGVESKRCEPYRYSQKVSFSSAFERPVWDEKMALYKQMKDKLCSGQEVFRYLDAAQLVKHALGLHSEGFRKKKQPCLVYLFAEPTACTGRLIYADERQEHRAEAARFAAAVQGANVSFAALSYRDWLDSWLEVDRDLVSHRDNIIAHFQP